VLNIPYANTNITKYPKTKAAFFGCSKDVLFVDPLRRKETTL
jgi:hypothetical protein